MMAGRGGRLLVTTMRNEGAFIPEWLAWHRRIGFSHFLIYTNDCEDGTDRILDRLAEAGLVTHRPNPPQGKKTIQWQALTRARTEPVLQAAEWVMVADVDEFLVIHAGGGRLDDLIAAAPEAGAFAIDWRMFGSGGRRGYEPGLVGAQFTRAAPEALVWPWRAVQFKTLFRNENLRQLGVHRPKFQAGAEPVWCDGNGRRVRAPIGTVLTHAGPRYGLAQLNHYALGSAEDFLVKADRGRPNRADLPIRLDYWLERNFDAAEDTSLARHALALAAEVAALLADPVLAALHARAVEWRRARIAALKAQIDPFYLYTALLAAGPTQVLPPAEQQALLRDLLEIIRRGKRDGAL